MTGGLLRRLPIRGKLVAMIMITTTAVLVLASAGYLAWDYYRLRLDLASELGVTARLVLENSGAPINFDDQEAALETLATLASVPRLRTACLYDARGALFASWAQGAAAHGCPQKEVGDTTAFAGGRSRARRLRVPRREALRQRATSAATRASWPRGSRCRRW